MNLNTRQKRLLELLSINARFSNKDIAKQIGVSEDTVEYQIEKLINQEKIAKFNVTFDYLQLGYEEDHFLIKLEKEVKDFSKLEEIEEIVSINTGYGKYDLQLIIIYKNETQRKQIIEKIKNTIKIKYYSICKFENFYKKFTNLIPELILNTKIPKNQKNPIYELNERIYMNKDIQEINKNITLDKKDKLIIKELLKSPTASYQELAKKTNLNHETIRYRIKNYVKERFIVNFGLIHDFQKYNLHTNYLLLNLKNFDETKFKKEILTNPNIFYSAKLKGDYNAIFYILGKDPTELGQNMQKILNSLDNNIIEYDLLIFDKLIKFVQFPKKELN